MAEEKKGKKKWLLLLLLLGLGGAAVLVSGGKATPVIPPKTHKECDVNDKCVDVAGDLPDTCTADGDCAVPMCVPGDKKNDTYTYCWDGSVQTHSWEECKADGFGYILKTETFNCPPAPVPGCTDPLATNFNPDATANDGSCTYPPKVPTKLLDDPFPTKSLVTLSANSNSWVSYELFEKQIYQFDFNGNLLSKFPLTILSDTTFIGNDLAVIFPGAKIGILNGISGNIKQTLDFSKTFEAGGGIGGLTFDGTNLIMTTANDDGKEMLLKTVGVSEVIGFSTLSPSQSYIWMGFDEKEILIFEYPSKIVFLNPNTFISTKEVDISGIFSDQVYGIDYYQGTILVWGENKSNNKSELWSIPY
mgnify:CR=1 FL=1